MSKESPVTVHVIVEKGGIVLAEMVTGVMGGRHEFTFSHPIRADGRHFEGFALEMHLDQVTRRVIYNESIERIAHRPALDLAR